MTNSKKLSFMADKNTIKVLLIEDNLQIAELIRDMLRRSSTVAYEVSHEINLTSALRDISPASADIIALDLTLPDSQGFQTFFSVRASAPDIPVIILTGTDDEEMAVQAVREGAQDYLVKSRIDMYVLWRSIQYSIERHRIERALRRAMDELDQRVKERTAELTMANNELQKEIEERVSAQSQLVQAAKMEVVGRLASGVAHEVRNPLAIILQGIEYLSGLVDLSNEDVASTIRSISKAVVRADTIVNGLLDFSRISRLESKACDIVPVIESGLLLIKHQCDLRHVKVVKNFASDIPRVTIDRNKIEQVLVNLCMNALDAMSSGGVLKVGASAVGTATGSAVCVEISDTGPGISPQNMDKIFDPFFTTKRSGSGTGLGLSIVKSIVEMHKGSIQIKNRAEGGAAVTMLLPV